MVAIGEELTCSPLDYQSISPLIDIIISSFASRSLTQLPYWYYLFLETQTLGLQLCAPFYEKNSTLGSAVSSEIATATSGAIAITAGKVPTNPAEYPLCAVSLHSFRLILHENCVSNVQLC